MRQVAKLLSLMVVTAIATLPLSQTVSLAQKPVELEFLESGSVKQAQTSSPEGTLAPGDQVLENDGRRFDSYSFQGESGTTLRITVTSEAFTPFVFLVDRTTGETIAQQVGDSNTVSLTVELPNDGEYWFGIAATEAPGEGAYQFQVVSVQAATGSQTEADRLLAQGFQQYENGQLEEAISAWQQALQLYQEIEALNAQFFVLRNIGLAYQGLGEYQLAEATIQQEIEVIRELIDTQGNSAQLRISEGQAIGRLGIIYRESGRYEEAIAVLEQRVEIAREIGDRSGEGVGYGNLGLAYAGLGQYEQAIEFYEQRLAIARELNERDKEGLTLVNLAEAYIELGQIDQAVELLEASLEIALELDLKDLEERVRHRLQLFSSEPQDEDIFLLETAASLDEGDDYIILRFDDDQPDSRRLTDTYQIQGRANQTIAVNVNSSGFIPSLRIFNADTNDWGAQSSLRLTLESEAWLIVTLPSDGTYSILVSSHQENTQGSYTLSIREAQSEDLLLSDAATLSHQASEQYELENYQAALRLNERALGLYRSEIVRDGFPEISAREEAELLGNIANAYDALGNYDQAIETQQQSINLKRALGDRYGEAFSLVNLGNTYRRARNYESAIEVYEEALEIWRELDLSEKEEEILDALGRTALDWSLHDRAIEFYEQSLAIKLSNSDRLGEALVLRTLGIAYYRSGRIDDAINAHEKSLAIARELGDLELEASALGNLANIYQTTGNFQLAVDLKLQALEIFRATDDLAGQSAVLNALGDIYAHAGVYQEAIDSYQASLAVAREIDDVEAEADSLNDLGYLYSVLGRTDQAMDLLEQSLVLFREVGDFDGEALALRNLGVIHPNFIRAIEFLNQSIDLAQELNDRSALARVWHDLGNFYYRNPIIVDVGNDDVLTADFRYAETLQAYQQALEISRQLGHRANEGITLGSLSRLYGRIGEHTQALKYALESLEISREVNSLSDEAQAWLRLARVHLDILNNTIPTDESGEELLEKINLDAERAFQEALNILDRLRTNNLSDTDHLSLFETQVDAYIAFQELLTSQNRYEEALIISERARARVLVQTLTDQLLSSPEQNSLSEIPSIKDIRLVAQQQDLTLVSYSWVGWPSNPTLHMWVVQPTGEIQFRSIDLPTGLPRVSRSEVNFLEEGRINFETIPSDSAGLTELIANTRDAIGVGDVDRASARPQIDPNQAAQDIARRRAETDENLRQLHQILIDPIADLLPTDPDAKVAFIPQGELFLVPFPALKDADGDYLIENHTILTAPSIQVLQLTHDLQSPSPSGRGARGEGPANPLIVGDPAMPTVTFLSEAGTFDAVRLQPLYGARQEAEAVGATLNAPVLLGADATEVRIKQQIASADLIHLATHGLLEYGDPRQTGSRDTPGAIALAPGNGEDGLLTSTEILQMELQADLVVLSACDTGRGRITGDGVIGLSRAFIAAGVPSIIVSLWAVPDAPTADLMTEFYNQLSQGETKAQALRQAMLITMQTHPDPKNWAAFTLIGATE